MGVPVRSLCPIDKYHNLLLLLTISPILRILACEYSLNGSFPLPAVIPSLKSRTFSNSSMSFPSKSLRALECSLSSFSSSPLLFSMVCTLFFQNTGGGVPASRLPFEISNIQFLFYRYCLPSSYSIGPELSSFTTGSQFCAPFVFIMLRIAFPASPFFSQPSELPGGVTP